MAIFVNDADRQDFLDLLGRCVSRFHLRIFAFCLMNNHYHLFLQTPEANLAKAFQWLNAIYVSRFHHRHGQSGHLFQGRYRAVLVAEEAHWQRLSLYIHLNPVRAGITRDPENFEWSSFRDYVRPRSRFAWLAREELLARYGSSDSARRRNYRREALELISQSPEFWSGLKNAALIGSRELVEQILRKYRPSGRKEDVTDFKKLARREANIQNEIERVARIFGVRAHELRKKRRNFPARLAVYYHLVENCGVGTSSLARAMQISPMAVSLGIKRFEQILRKQPSLRKKLKELSLM